MNKQTIIIHAESQRAACQLILANLPADGSMQVVISAYAKPGSAKQRGAYWGVRMAEIADQAWWEGRQYSPNVWHQYFKERFLPDKETPGITLDGYLKWVELPNGTLSMIGSTERLTSKGRAEYMEQVEAFAVMELGVRLSDLKSRDVTDTRR